MKIKFLLSLLTVLTLQKISFSQNKPVEYLDPVPGAKYVSRNTTIIVKPFIVPGKNIIGNSDLITVRGTKSGNHTGRLIISTDGKTVIFKPEKEFEYFDTVFVKISSNLTKSSAFEYYFIIKSRDADANIKSSIEMETGIDFNKNRNILPGIKYSPDSIPSDFPHININISTAPSYGSIFLCIINSFVYTTPYLMILDNTGYPVFYRRTFNNTTDFKMQPNGNLTYFEYNKNKFYELDKQYRLIDSFYTGNNYITDAHELRILNDGSSYLMSYDPEVVNMSLIVPGGDTAAIVQGLIIQRIDVNKNVIFQWRSWDHFLITDATHENLHAHSIDYVHGNSIEIDNNETIILSSRHLDEITKINCSTGDIIWRLGGKNNQFTFLNDTSGFSHQHAVRKIQNGNITVFDNGNYHTPNFSRAVEYHLDENNKIAALVWQFRNTPDIHSSFMGYVQRLDNGNTFIGWGGANPSVTEVNNSGTVVFQLDMPLNVFSYRAYRLDWSPSAAVLISPLNNSLYISTTPHLEWFAVPHATAYRIQISKNPEFTEISFDTSGILTSMINVPSGKLNVNTKYYWRVYSDFGGSSGTWSDIWNFSTGIPLISVPILIEPFNRSNDISLTPQLMWGFVTNALTYEIQLTSDSLFVNVELDSSKIVQDIITVPDGLLFPLSSYYWRVRAENNGVLSPWSDIWEFTTTKGIPTKVELISPADNSINIPKTVTFQWYKINDNIINTKKKTTKPGLKPEAPSPKRIIKYHENNIDTSINVFGYWFELSTDSTFRSSVIKDSTILDTLNEITGLNNLTKYFWRVKARNESGWGDFSDIWSFTTIVHEPSAPALISPQNNSSGLGLTPLLDWKPVSLASSYSIQISTDSLFITTVYNNILIQNHELTVPSGKLNYLTKYYWRVNASNAGGTSPWSTPWSFTTSQGLPLTLKFYLEGFWNGNEEISDTANIYLANASYPYSLSDSINNILFSPEGTLNAVFTKAQNGNYYIVIKHRNHLETWSADSISFITGIPVSYDFTISANKAFGNNMKQVGNVWVLIGGDPNQDGSIDAIDLPVFISQYGLQGYLSCDFNGDGDVNALDVQILVSNYGLTKATPLEAGKSIGKRINDDSKSKVSNPTLKINNSGTK